MNLMRKVFNFGMVKIEKAELFKFQELKSGIEIFHRCHLGVSFALHPTPVFLPKWHTKRLKKRCHFSFFSNISSACCAVWVHILGRLLWKQKLYNMVKKIFWSHDVAPTNINVILGFVFSTKISPTEFSAGKRKNSPKCENFKIS